MRKKYAVGVDGGDVLGVYYAENETEAISECRQDHLFQNGERMSHNTCGVSARDMMHNLIAVLQE